jgi:hypothetical protein
MTFESVEIPAERLPPVAVDQANSSKTVAGVLFFLTAVVVLAMIGVLTDGGAEHADGARDSAEAAGRTVGTFVGMLLFGGIPAVIAFRAARNASRATRAGKLASADPSYTWRLSGKYIVGTDAAGMTPPDLEFKINGKLRTMLLQLPRASLVP